MENDGSVDLTTYNFFMDQASLISTDRLSSAGNGHFMVAIAQNTQSEKIVWEKDNIASLLATIGGQAIAVIAFI